MIYNSKSAKHVVCPYELNSKSPKPCQTWNCALWRWAEGEEIKVDELDYRVYDANYGFCGLGGKPVNDYKQP